jgi:dihydrodipicolinate synthase/N-acetylneuraminate lyase
MAEASFTAHFFAVVKEALVQQGIIAHNTSAAPFSQADERVRRHVAAALDRAREIRALEMRP